MTMRATVGFEALTERERQTLRVIVRGHDAKSIARRRRDGVAVLIGQENLPAPPDGYEVVKFRTRFADREDAVETVTLEL